jgi:dienelactone hydrolase
VKFFFLARVIAKLVICFPFFSKGNCATAPSITSARVHVAGEPLGVTVLGLTPNERVRVHALQRTTRSTFENGAVKTVPVVAHAWGLFKTDSGGGLSLSRTTAIDGSFTGDDPQGLLWSGYSVGDAKLAKVASVVLPFESIKAEKKLYVFVERQGKILASDTISIVSSDRTLTVKDLNVAQNGVSGVFAAPESAIKVKTLILLHGSEGGDMVTARRRATAWAQRGYAVLALNYVAYSWEGGIAGVEPVFANIPVELIDRARTYLGTETAADIDRIGLVGGSKGAEFALLAATKLPWVRGVVACVPSDVVWSGFGREADAGETLSSWSWQNKPLPFVAYDRYEDVFSGAATSVQVHDRSRAKLSIAQLASVLIPVEQIKAPVLLLGSDQDQTWSSGMMARQIEKRLRRARPATLVKANIFPLAGHNICGTGASPLRISGDAKDADADAAATRNAFATTIAFLSDVLAE